MEQNWWYDGRRDVLAATRAALTYLQKLYNLFGSWELALAAYKIAPPGIEGPAGDLDLVRLAAEVVKFQY